MNWRPAGILPRQALFDLGDPFSDLESDRPAYAVERLGFDNLAKFDHLNAGHVVAALNDLAGFLADFEAFGFMSDRLPLLDLSFRNLFGTGNAFTAATQAYEGNEAPTLQALQVKLAEAFAPLGATIVLSVPDGTDTLKIGLEFSKEFDGYPDITLGLGAGKGALTGSPGLQVEGSTPFHLVLGIDLTDPGHKIYIKNGTYEGELSVPNGVGLYGESKDDTVIKGNHMDLNLLVGKGGNIFNNLTVSGGGAAVYFEGTGTVDNCVIKNAAKIGINLPPGSGRVDVKNSTITSNGKGMYIQKGRKVYITNNEVTGNDEEGLDLRDKISGRISGNYIGGNSEGGIEIILGSSDVAIEDNTIKKNSASGIAAQFYSSSRP